MLPDGIHRIPLPTPFQIGDVNAWLRRPRRPRGELARRSGAAVAGTAALARFMADTDAAMDADDAYSIALMRRHGVTEKTVETLHGISRAFRRYVGDARVDTTFADGDELVAGSRTWRVRERPGHGPTDTVLASDRVLVADNHLLERISSNPIAHVPIGAADPAALAASPDRHGDPFTGAAALVEKRLAMRDRRAGKIFASLTHPRSAADTGRDLWRHVPVTQAHLVLSEVLGHLDLLEARGAVATGERDGVVRYAATATG